MITIDEVRSIYEKDILATIDAANHYRRDKVIYDANVARLTGLLEQVSALGYSVQYIHGEGGHALNFVEKPKEGGADPVPISEAKDLISARIRLKSLSDMTDRELLLHFADAVCTYDQLRDDELDFLSDHPNRDAWDEEEEQAYKEKCDCVKAQYAKVDEIIEHINKERQL